MTKPDVVLDAVVPLLTRLGFKKRQGGVFTIPLSQDVQGWLGLNRSTRHRPAGEVEINPVVGVHHKEIERLWDELRGGEAKGHVVATIATPLGYVSPEAKYRGWVFTADRSEAVASDMVAEVEKHGLPYMRSIAGLHEICRALEPRSNLGLEHYAQYRRPLAWLLAGDARRAADELDKVLVAIGERSTLADEEFRRFALALRARIPAS